MYIWTILAVVSFVLLIIYWSSKNAVWGGLTLGIINGLLWKFLGGTDWYMIGRVAIIGTLLGFGAELLGMLSDYLKRRSQ